MTELTYIQEDVERLVHLHSWYKGGKKMLWPFLWFGQEPRNAIHPEINPAYKDQLRWWFVAEPPLEQFEKLFESKTDALFVWNASKQYACQIDALFGSDDLSSTFMIATLKINAVNFYVATKAIYDKKKQERLEVFNT